MYTVAGFCDRPIPRTFVNYVQSALNSDELQLKLKSDGGSGRPLLNLNNREESLDVVKLDNSLNTRIGGRTYNVGLWGVL